MAGGTAGFWFELMTTKYTEWGKVSGKGLTDEQRDTLRRLQNRHASYLDDGTSVSVLLDGLRASVLRQDREETRGRDHTMRGIRL